MATPNAEAAPQRPTWERVIVIVIIAAFTILAVGFSLGPIMESPDEWEHYEFIRTLNATHQLPDPSNKIYIQDHQAPLYYVIAAPLNWLINPDNVPVESVHNPFYGYGLAYSGGDNKNLWLHDASEAFPYTDSPLARTHHILRLYSVLLSVCNLIISYAIFRLIWPDKPYLRVMALGFVAFWPQFVWLSSVLNNDNLLNLLSTLSLFLLLRQLKHGPSLRRSILLGVVLGAALLSKASAVFLAIPVGVAFLSDRKAWKHIPVTLSITLAIGAWWYIRNLQLVGTLSGWDLYSQWGGAIRDGKVAIDVAFQRLPFAWWGFMGRFGCVVVPMEQEVYSFLSILIILALAGIIYRGIRYFIRKITPEQDKTSSRMIIVMAVFVLTWVIALIYQAGLVYQGNQGRYLLPMLAAWGPAMALGLTAWLPRKLHPGISLTSIVIMCGLTTFALLHNYLPSYRPGHVPETMEKPLMYRYEDTAELIGMAPAAPHGRPGEIIEITLYWRALRPSEEELRVYLHSETTTLIRRDSYPATGNMLSTDWQPGMMWAETYWVEIPADAVEQTTDNLLAGLYDAETGVKLTARAENGEEVTPVIGQIAINGAESESAPAYIFGDMIGLEQPDISPDGSRMSVCLNWLSLAPTTTNYQVFVHVLDDNGQLITQADHAPHAGHYPMQVWRPGERIEDCVTTGEIPPDIEQLQFFIGLYDLETSLRLPVQDADGRQMTDEMIVVESTAP